MNSYEKVSSPVRITYLSLRPLLLLVIICFSHMLKAQIYNVNYANINFGDTGVTIIPKVGDGLSPGNIVLYQNVITVSGQQIDAIIRTIEIPNGSYTNYDYDGSGQANQKRWFSPQVNFAAGGGYLRLRFEFILGGSYNNTTNTGTAVTLQNVVLNTYDIDGNGNSNSNQFCDFENFISSELGNPTNIEYNYFPSTGLTRFRSLVSTNNSNPADEITRVRLTYNYLSYCDVMFGSEGNGSAYFFLDFSGGTSFATAVTSPVPELDLDTYTDGLDHHEYFLGDAVFFTKGAANISYSGSSITDLTVNFDNTLIPDSSSEKLLFNGSGSDIALNFSNGQAIPDITLGGLTVSVTASVNGTRSELVFAKSGGGAMTISEAELLLDAIQYDNLDASPTVVDRIFELRVRDSNLVSSNAVFTVEFSSEMPVKLIFFEAMYSDSRVKTSWATASEYDNDHFCVERSADLENWTVIAMISGAGNSQLYREYENYDSFPLDGISYYRLKQVDISGDFTHSPVRSVTTGNVGVRVILDRLAGEIKLILPDNWCGRVELYDLMGYLHHAREVTAFTDRTIILDMSEKHTGKYLIKCIGNEGDLEVLTLLK